MLKEGLTNEQIKEFKALPTRNLHLLQQRLAGSDLVGKEEGTSVGWDGTAKKTRNMMRNKRKRQSIGLEDETAPRKVRKSINECRNATPRKVRRIAEHAARDDITITQKTNKATKTRLDGSQKLSSQRKKTKNNLSPNRISEKPGVKQLSVHQKMSKNTRPSSRMQAEVSSENTRKRNSLLWIDDGGKIVYCP